MKKIFVGMVVMALLFLVRCEQPIEPADIIANRELISELKYDINIDCEYIRDNEHNSFVIFDDDAIILCKRYFPDLWEEK